MAFRFLRKSQQRRPVSPKASFVPWLEALEDRTVPSTLTVLNNLDSGAGSLRDAIAQANSGDTIAFNPSLDGLTITLTRGQLSIKKNLTIQGPGAGLLAVSGNDTSRVFDISSNQAVTITGLTITHGTADHGGSILDEVGASLTLADVVLSSNHASGGFGDGAVFNDVHASLNITDSTLTQNGATTAVKFTTGQGGGGAILNEAGASLSVTGSTLSNNQAVTTVGFDNMGGALYNNGGTTTITNSTLANNQVLGGGSFSSAIGGSGRRSARASHRARNLSFSAWYCRLKVISPT